MNLSLQIDSIIYCKYADELRMDCLLGNTVNL